MFQLNQERVASEDKVADVLAVLRQISDEDVHGVGAVEVVAEEGIDVNLLKQIEWYPSDLVLGRLFDKEGSFYSGLSRYTAAHFKILSHVSSFTSFLIGFSASQQWIIQTSAIIVSYIH